MCRIGACTIESETFDRLGDTIGYLYRVAALTFQGGVAPDLQCLLHVKQSANKGSGVFAVKANGVKTVGGETFFKTFDAFTGAELGALFDSPAVGNHNRKRHTAIVGPPPAWNPVTATLLFRRAIGKKRHQRFAWQWHMGILKLGKAEIAALDNSACCVWVYMAAQWGCHGAVLYLPVAVQIGCQQRQAIGSMISGALLGVQVSGQNIPSVHSGTTVALPHQPAARGTGQIVQSTVGSVGRHKGQPDCSELREQRASARHWSAGREQRVADKLRVYQAADQR